MELTPDDVGDIAEIPSISSRDYLVALAERERMKASFNAAIEGADALLTPTALTPAPPVASIDQNTTPAVFTRWVNFLELCAVAVPNGSTASGLPTSLQIVCRAYAEPMALRIGHAYQAALDWHLRVPPMAAQACSSASRASGGGPCASHSAMLCMGRLNA